jgi:hypothetical protein
MKTLILSVLLVCSALAVDLVDKPFLYFLKSMEGISADTVYYGITPTIAIPDLILTRAKDGKRGIAVEAFNSIGAGIDYGRYIKSVDGKVYETFGGSLIMFFNSSKMLIIGGVVHVFDRRLGIGVGANLGDVPRDQIYTGFLTTGLKPW